MNLTEEIFSKIIAAPEQQKLAVLQMLRGEYKPEVSTLTFNISEAGKRAGVSRQTVYIAIKAGVLRAAPLYSGGRPRIRQTDLQAWIGAAK